MAVAIIDASRLIKIAEGAFYVPSVDKVIDRPFQVGDTVKYTGTKSYNIPFNSVSSVIEVVLGAATDKTVSYKGSFYVIMRSRLKVTGDRYNRHSATSFNLNTKGSSGVIEMPSTILSIDTDRPCLVFELDTAENGKTTPKDIKNAKAFDSMREAKAWVEEQIVTSIRENNVYPKYSVYEERFVGRAEKPPVVFE